MSSEPRNIAVFGAGGNNIGHHLLKALLSHSDHFTVSVIARASSQTNFPAAAKLIRLPAEPSHADLVNDLRGLDAVISAVSYPAVLEEPKIIDAATEAGVQRFIPSEYGINNSHAAARELSAIFAAKADVMDYLKTKEGHGLSWTCVPTGLWLDWCIKLVPAFAGIYAKSHKAELWNNGNYHLSWSTLPWAAEAIVQILRNPELTKNKVIPVRSFEASQRDIVSVLEKIQGVKYDLTQIDGAKVIAENKKRWGEGDKTALLPLAQAGILTSGFGSNLVDDGLVEIGSDKLDLPILTLGEVVAAAVKAL